MAKLPQLPPELVLCIYEYFENIDDVLHFARSCSKVYALFHNTDIRLRIFKCVLERSSHHGDEIQLVQYEYANRHSPGTCIMESGLHHQDNILPIYQTGMQFDSSSFAHLPAETIWHVVFRWQLVKILFWLYLNPIIQKIYHDSPLIPEHCITEPNLPFQEQSLPGLRALVKGGKSCLTPSMQRAAYERFYKATICHWLDVEILLFARNSSYSNTKTRDHFFHSVLDRWASPLDGKSLSDHVDIVEICDFIWGFLGYKALHMDFMVHAKDWAKPFLSTARVSGDAGNAPCQDLRNIADDSKWSLFWPKVSTCLRPHHILGILLHSTWSPTTGGDFDRNELLREIGLPESSLQIEDSPEEFPLAHCLTFQRVLDDLGCEDTEISIADITDERSGWWREKGRFLNSSQHSLEDEIRLKGIKLDFDDQRNATA